MIYYVCIMYGMSGENNQIRTIATDCQTYKARREIYAPPLKTSNLSKTLKLRIKSNFNAL